MVLDFEHEHHYRFHGFHHPHSACASPPDANEAKDAAARSFLLRILVSTSPFQVYTWTDSSSTCVISLVRISKLAQGINTTDPYWDNAPGAYWSVVELNCGILCACLPTLRPLISLLIPNLLSTNRHSGAASVDDARRLTFPHNNTKETIQGSEAGILVQTEVELHSTTDLRSGEPGYRPSMESHKTTVTSHS